jgi:predicted transcriptional regulator
MYIYHITRRTHMATRVLSATVDEALADRLEHLASETSRKKSYFVNLALKEYFMALDDYEIALKRKGGAATPIDRAMKELGL